MNGQLKRTNKGTLQHARTLADSPNKVRIVCDDPGIAAFIEGWWKANFPDIAYPSHCRFNTIDGTRETWKGKLVIADARMVSPKYMAEADILFLVCFDVPSPPVNIGTLDTLAEAMRWLPDMRRFDVEQYE
jgi:hypothetical protein